MSWITEINELFHDILIYWDAPVYGFVLSSRQTIVSTTNDRFTNNLPDLSQLLCVPINTNELDEITSNMGTIFSDTLEAVAPSN